MNKKSKIEVVKSSKYIKLVSSENKEFYVNKDVVMISKTLANTLESGMKESSSAEIKLDI